MCYRRKAEQRQAHCNHADKQRGSQSFLFWHVNLYFCISVRPKKHLSDVNELHEHHHVLEFSLICYTKQKDKKKLLFLLPFSFPVLLFFLVLTTATVWTVVFILCWLCKRHFSPLKDHQAAPLHRTSLFRFVMTEKSTQSSQSVLVSNALKETCFTYVRKWQLNLKRLK